MDEETINKYIKNQKWEQQDQGFKITAPNRALSRLSLGSPSVGVSRHPDLPSEIPALDSSSLSGETTCRKPTFPFLTVPTSAKPVGADS